MMSHTINFISMQFHEGFFFSLFTRSIKLQIFYLTELWLSIFIQLITKQTRNVSFSYVLDSSSIWTGWVLIICFYFFHCSCLQKTTTIFDIQNLTRRNRWTVEDIRLHTYWSLICRRKSYMFKSNNFQNFMNFMIFFLFLDPWSGLKTISKRRCC